MLRLRSLLAVLVSLALPSIVFAQTAAPSGGSAPPSGGGFSLISIMAVGVVVLVLAVVARRRAQRSGSRAQHRITVGRAVAAVVAALAGLVFAFAHIFVRGLESGTAKGKEGDLELFGNVRLAGLAVFVAALLIAFHPQVREWLRQVRAWLRPRVPASIGSGKTCPDCAEIVKQAARKCRFCGYRFDEGVQQDG